MPVYLFHSYSLFIEIADSSFAMLAREIKEKSNFYEVCKNAYEPKFCTYFDDEQLL